MATSNCRYTPTGCWPWASTSSSKHCAANHPQYRKVLLHCLLLDKLSHPKQLHCWIHYIYVIQHFEVCKNRFATTCLLSAKCPCPVTTPDGRPNMVYQVGYGKVWRASNTLYIPCAKLNIQTLLWDSPYSTFNNLDPITAQFSLLLGIWA